MMKLTSSETMLEYLITRIIDLNAKADEEYSSGNILQYAVYSTQISTLKEVYNRLTKGGTSDEN